MSAKIEDMLKDPEKISQHPQNISQNGEKG